MKIYLAILPFIKTSVIIGQLAIPSVFYQLRQCNNQPTIHKLASFYPDYQFKSQLASFAASQVFITRLFLLKCYLFRQVSSVIISYTANQPVISLKRGYPRKNQPAINSALNLLKQAAGLTTSQPVNYLEFLQTYEPTCRFNSQLDNFVSSQLANRPVFGCNYPGMKV